MLPELKEAEKVLNNEYNKLSKAAQDGSWNFLKTVEKKAKADPARLLLETFPRGANGWAANLDIVVVKLGPNG